MTQDIFERLRRLLAQQPSRTTWDGIVQLFEHWRDESNKDVALAYANDHMAHWPVEFRESHDDGSQHPAWPLVRCYVLKSTNRKKIREIASYPHIQGIRLALP